MRVAIFIIFFLFIADNCSAQSAPKVSSGHISRIENFQSKFVRNRNIDVWLPDEYSTNKKYTVLYMQEGQMLFDSTNTWNHQEWCVDETMDMLIRSGKIKECIVVAIPSFTRLKFTEYFPDKILSEIPIKTRNRILEKELNGYPQGDNYLKFIVTELKPTIDKQFSTNTDVNHTFIMGASIGGLISIYALCEYPDVFGGAACLSLHSPIVAFELINNQTDEDVASKFRNYLERKLPSPNSRKIYFDYGTMSGDSLYKPFQSKIDSVMRTKGYRSPQWVTLEFPGEYHNEASWAKRLNYAFEFLLQNENNE